MLVVVVATLGWMCCTARMLAGWMSQLRGEEPPGRREVEFKVHGSGLLGRRRARKQAGRALTVVVGVVRVGERGATARNPSLFCVTSKSTDASADSKTTTRRASKSTPTKNGRAHTQNAKRHPSTPNRGHNGCLTGFLRAGFSVFRQTFRTVCPVASDVNTKEKPWCWVN
jgi:hypothetical protein